MHKTKTLVWCNQYFISKILQIEFSIYKDVTTVDKENMSRALYSNECIPQDFKMKEQLLTQVLS